ncbi:hypothetical protein AA106555_1344 [Neokomagataea thailandica NBRC 106555]|uniref:LPS-assembly lipoprotein n=2 Tax=Neokomagataea TaxID=1223423 RepID=A0A4Y6V5R4_9PROT|nr:MULTISPECIES: hypothetical protein [Neokomagataea]QDH25409.1 hypothetical protein D5366_09510 [Neokomagataea tanensis]GBR53559.1 hypothetical protein AA106555_1344 [Neokomagataea thailandica NBRC 106555]
MGIFSRLSVGISLVCTLAGCGFTPLYGGGKNGQAVSPELAQVYVANIGGRYGQLLRLALQKDLTGSGSETPQLYTLQVSSGLAEEAVDIHQDNTSGRIRGNANAHWRLYTVATVPELLAEGNTRTMDGYNTLYEQYFAQTLNEETLQARVAETLAQSVKQQLAIWFRTHHAPGAGQSAELPRYINTDAMPDDNGTPTETTGADGFPASATGRLTHSTSTSSDQ